MDAYSQLIKAEGLNQYLQDFIGENAPQFSTEEITKAEADIISQYENNSLLENALTGRETISAALERLGKVNKGILNKYLPRKKDEYHNKEVKEMGELVGSVNQLESKGVLSYENPLTNTIYWALAGVVTGYLFGEVVSVTTAPPEMAGFTKNTSLYAFPVLMSVFSIPFGLARSGRLNPLPAEEAAGLDKIVDRMKGSPSS